MIEFKAEIKKYREQAEKSGWTYIDVPLDLAEQLNPDTKKLFRVKGKIDQFTYQGLSLYPVGEGNYILALNSFIRSAIRKDVGATVVVTMEVDSMEKQLSGEFLECLQDEPSAEEFFNSLPKSHQRYFSNWIETAKTEATKTKRIAMAINALAQGFGFGEMIPMNKKKE